MILKHQYKPKPDGLGGNDDCGQMSAWYIFSAMGFYPVCPGSNQYIIGTPKLNKVVIHLDNAKSFSITANNLSDKNFYIQSLSLNGKPLDRSYITHEEIMAGGDLIFMMGDTPNKTWATNKDALPYSISK